MPGRFLFFTVSNSFVSCTLYPPTWENVAPLGQGNVEKKRVMRRISLDNPRLSTAYSLYSLMIFCKASISSCTPRLSLSISSTLATECMAVEWSRLNFLPMSL